MGQLWTLFLLAVFLFVQDVLCHLPRRGPYFMMGRPADGFRPLDKHYRHTLSMNANEASDVEEYWFEQKLDHFDTSTTNDKVFQQRYFYNGKYYKEGGPIILMIGGEGPENGAWAGLEGLAYFEWVKTFNAAIFDLEHRFYGKTRPFEEQTTENLKYLSSRQAIEDIADFIRAMNVKYNYSDPRWVVYGGSYPGALALWFRQKHPELAIGAVGSSGPMLAALDFHEYLEDVEEAFNDYTNCPNREAVITNMKDGFNEINKLIWTLEGRQTLTDTFTLVPALSKTKLRHKDIQNFISTLVGNFMGSVQYNRDNMGKRATGGGIPELCALMSNDSYPTNLEKIAAVNKYMTEFYDGSFTNTDIDYDAMIQYLRDPTYDEEGELTASRSWIWQTCTEFAYFQTTGYGGSIFGSGFPLNLYVDLCKDIFGAKYDVETIQESVHSSNEFYGGIDHFSTSNSVLIYGTIDPWHKLGFYQNSSSVNVYLISGTAHCSDMYYPNATTDVPELTEVRKRIIEHIKSWLAQTPQANHFVSYERIEEEQRLQPEPFVSTIKERKMTAAEKEEALRKMPRKVRSDLPFMLFGRPYHGLVADPPSVGLVANEDDLVVGRITQPVDHSNTASGTFEQRYWINTKYYKPEGPQFLFLEGEGTARTKWLLTNVTFMRAVQKFNAMAFVLEHRFYGESWINKSMSSDKLQFLTTDQALLDISQFIDTMNKNYSFQNPKWVTFGGSYPGSLSGWFRQEYPEKSVGAVASSAGTDLKLNYFDYLTVTEQSLRHYSEACADNVQKAFNDMHQMSLTPAGRVNLSNIFNLKPEWTATSVVTTVDVQYFFSNVYDKYQSAVQYNNDNTGTYMNGGGIQETCQIMKNSSVGTEVQRVAEVYKYIVNFHGGDFQYVDNRYQNYVDLVKKDDYSDEEATDARGWMWECCNEIGYLQSTDGDNIFASVTPIDFWMNFCEDVFGSQYLKARDLYTKVEKAQKHHKGRDYYSATNVFFTSGKIDPWHLLAIPKTRETDTMRIFLLNETAHCADMYPPRSKDPQELTDVREQQFASIARWISGPDLTTASSTDTSTTKSSSHSEYLTALAVSLLIAITKLVL